MVSLYNTLTRQKQEFIPLADVVTLYNCGPTVYHDQHIGNFRTAMTVDLVKRTLLTSGYAVKHITNITDVGHLTDDAHDSGEDKIEVGAKREGISAFDVARKYESLYIRDIERLNNIAPDKWTRATEHIPQQIELIKKLEAQDLIYRTSDGIYFDTSKCADYGKLAGLQNVQLQAGIRVDLGEKKNPTDFALWKFAAEDAKRQMEWDSPWGVGFPGWHIECSAMAMEYLGETIDIHAGATDLIPVHHTNEIAQSECATGKQFVRYWVHGAFVVEGEEKMSKSKGNIKTLDWVVESGFTPLDYRYLTLQTHYRKELSVTFDSLTAASVAHKKLRTFIARTEVGGEVLPEFFTPILEAFQDDINAPRALASVWDMMNSKAPDTDKRATLIAADQLFGLQFDAITPFVPEEIPETIEKIIAARKIARETKDWAASDRLREEAHALGWEIVDTADGQTATRVI